jgi:hypothetical protein
MSDTDKSWPSLKASLIITTTGGNCPTQLRQIVRRRHGPGVRPLRIELRARWKSVGSLSRVSSAARYSGTLLRRILPKHHLTADSKDVVKLGMGLIATMSALVLGQLIASAKDSYDTQRTDHSHVRR